MTLPDLVTDSRHGTWRTLQRAAPRLVSAPDGAGEDSSGYSVRIDIQDSRRRLPHHYPPGKWLFITWHLHGSLPHGLYPPPGKLSGGKAFVWMDRYLDATGGGPLYLRRKEIAQIVVESLKRGAQLGHYELRAYVVMANHVHVLLRPQVAPARLLQSLKGVTARDANRLLGRTGESFWQRESYDHWVRDAKEFERIVAYIENNPARAGLVMRAEDYPWSSAAEGRTRAPRRVSARHAEACATSSQPQGEREPEYEKSIPGAAC